MDSQVLGKLGQHSLVILITALVAGCGGGGGSAVEPPPPIVVVPPPVVVAPVKYAVGGSVTGLAPGAALALNYGSERLSIAADGSFAFPTKVETGSTYSITAIAPAGYSCRVSDGAGVVASADVSKVAVACAPVVLAGVVATFQAPLAVESDGAGNLYVVDGQSASVMKVSAAGAVTVVAGMRGQPGYADGPGASARFGFGRGDLALDAQGNILVADGCNNVIRKIKPDGEVSTLAGNGPQTCRDWVAFTMDGAAPRGEALQLESPRRIIPDGAGGALVLKSINNWTVHKVSAAGVVTTQAWNNPVPQQSFVNFNAIARGADGTLYLADTRARLWKDVAGTLVLVAGSAPSSTPRDGTGSGATFRRITDMVVAPDGNLYIADSAQVRKVTPAGVVTTLAGGIDVRAGTDGQGAAAGFGSVGSITLDGAGLVVLDEVYGTLRRVGFDGVVSTLAVTPYLRSNTDGTGNLARFGAVTALSADADGNLYTTSPGGIGQGMRKISPDGVVTSFITKYGMTGVDGPLESAVFVQPHTIVPGPGGAIWVAQNTGLRKIQNGAVTTVGSFLDIAELTVDGEGNVFIVDFSSQVTRVSSTGEKTVLLSREHVAALLKNPETSFAPEGMAVDAAGSLYIADRGTAVVYKRTKSGELSVFAGTPMKDKGDIDGAVGTATFGFYNYGYLTIDDKGNLYLSGQGKVRMISPAGVVSTPNLGWGNTSVAAIAYAKGKLYGLTRYALLQTWL